MFNPLSAKLRAWVERYFSGDNSITNQLVEMVDLGRDFEVINASRFGNAEQLAARNPIVCSLTNAGYVYAQCFAISRLTDRQDNKKGREVVSITGLLDEIEVNKHLFTRKNYVFLDSSQDPDMEEFHRCVRRRRFDELSRARPGDPQDLLHPDLIRTLRRMLRSREIEKVRVHRDKVLGHAALSENYAAAVRRLPGDSLTPKGSIALTMRDFERAQRALCVVGSFLDGVLLYNSSSSYVPTAQYDPFEGLETGWWSDLGEAKARVAYEVYGRRRARWSGSSAAIVVRAFNHWFPPSS